MNKVGEAFFMNCTGLGMLYAWLGMDIYFTWHGIPATPLILGFCFWRGIDAVNEAFFNGNL